MKQQNQTLKLPQPNNKKLKIPNNIVLGVIQQKSLCYNHNHLIYREKPKIIFISQFFFCFFCAFFIKEKNFLIQK